MCSEPGFGASVSVSRTTTGAGSRSRPRLWAAREALAQIASVATPATLLRWYLSSAIKKIATRCPVGNTDTKLLIYGLFQMGRVLAQDGVADGAVWSYPVSAGNHEKQGINREYGHKIDP